MRITTRLAGAAALLALSTAGLLGGTATAKPGAEPVDAGDPRAVVGEQKNVDIGQPGNACEVVGLPGDEFTMPAGTFTVEGVYIDVTANPEGYVVTGVVVKGGSAYNVYAASGLGELPWLDLHPPINASDGPAGISHWFACVEKSTTPEEPGEETPEVVPTTTVATTTTTTTTTTSATTTTVAATPTSTTTPAAAATGDDLANTGFNGGWLLLAGLALVGAGAAFIASPKLRTLLRR